MKKNYPSVQEYGVEKLKPGDKLHFWSNSIAVVTLVSLEKGKKGVDVYIRGEGGDAYKWTQSGLSTTFVEVGE